MKVFNFIFSVIFLSTTLSHKLLSEGHHKRGPFPIQFAISESKIVKEIPPKTKDFAFIIPGKLDTYIYTEEADYYKDYQHSYFAITCKKAGWDCMRHYEILANGCIPYFIDIDKCNPNTMCFLPRELIKEAMNLEGVSFPHIDHSKFNKEKYYEILQKLMDHTKHYLTTRNMAEYVLNTVGYTGSGKILYLSKDLAPDYMRCLLLTGLKELLGERIVDFPKIPHIYKSYPLDIKKIYGRGFSYTKILDDRDIDRTAIEQRIKNKEFDLIIYGSVHRGLLFHDLVTQVYPAEKILYICGDDLDYPTRDFHRCPYANFSNLFLREFYDLPIK